MSDAHRYDIATGYTKEAADYIARALNAYAAPREPTGERPFHARFTIAREPDDGLVYITHECASLVGQGVDLESAMRDLVADLPGVFAVYAGRDDLSERAVEMVEWIQSVTGLRAPTHEEEETP